MVRRDGELVECSWPEALDAAGCGRVERLRPRALDQLAVAAHHGLADPLVRVDDLVPEPPLVAEPAVVHRLLSTPSSRTSWFELDSSVPMAVHRARGAARLHRVVGHGRKRYGVAVSAPTGQICTTLPEKYEVNGSAGLVMTSVWFPRPPNAMSASVRQRKYHSNYQED